MTSRFSNCYKTNTEQIDHSLAEQFLVKRQWKVQVDDGGVVDGQAAENTEQRKLLRLFVQREFG